MADAVADALVVDDQCPVAADGAELRWYDLAVDSDADGMRLGWRWKRALESENRPYGVNNARRWRGDK